MTGAVGPWFDAFWEALADLLNDPIGELADLADETGGLGVGALLGGAVLAASLGQAFCVRLAIRAYGRIEPADKERA